MQGAGSQRAKAGGEVRWRQRKGRAASRECHGDSCAKRAIFRGLKGIPMRIERRFTKDGKSGQSTAYAEIEFRKALSEIRNPDGSVVFRA